MEKGKELAPRRKRGRPARRTEISSNAAINKHPESVCPQDTPKSSPFSQLLRTILRQDRRQLLRVAQELGVSENSIYRWMNGSTEPRIHHLKRLPEVLPDYREALLEAINVTFYGILNPNIQNIQNIQNIRGKTDFSGLEGSQIGKIGEVPKEIYRRVIELISMSDEDDIRFWEVTQAVFEHALYHLDGEMRGMAISYAHLLSPREDGIHALREAIMRGHGPWPLTAESRVYLGSTSLAGTAATLQRMQIWDGSDSRLQVEVDEHERSACATPVVRGSRIAGVLIVSSTNADFFRQPMACQAVGEYTQLLSLSLHERDFQPFSLLHLRPMPDLAWQREHLRQNYAARVVNYARKQQSSRQEAERFIQKEIELEFEQLCQEQVQQQHQEASLTQKMPSDIVHTISRLELR
jgi:transcriptional regulator with XRE-family HTH domain